ncbi:Gamma-glutamyltranspeptidase precursor [Hafnia alvei]|uniref:Gamma-glutamyltranspeptidase n=1 Tax=Hafnia alvei TaxID=569 RepID=A0A377PLN8_HAFAL|nr:Gamma-glutamyltranspeptidase precursor [Hafnia alvei]
MTEAMRHAYMDRNTFLGDPAFVKNPTEKLLSKEYAAEIRKQIQPEIATPSSRVQPGMEPHEKPETTHYSIVDHNGNAVSTTYTINGRFGSVVIAPGTGFFLNDEMDDFTVKVGEQNMYGLVQGATNAIAPGKRPLSSMTPTLVTKDGKVFMVVGSPGGSRIITITLQTVLNVIDHGMAPQEAVDAREFITSGCRMKFTSNSAASRQTPKNCCRNAAINWLSKPLGEPLNSLWSVCRAPPVFSSESSGNDSAVSGKVREGFIYGANDVRRPSGSAVGY